MFCSAIGSDLAKKKKNPVGPCYSLFFMEDSQQQTNAEKHLYLQFLSHTLGEGERLQAAVRHHAVFLTGVSVRILVIIMLRLAARLVSIPTYVDVASLSNSEPEHEQRASGKRSQELFNKLTGS